MTEEEYVQYELQFNIRHEYINGQLIDMPGEATLNILIANNLVFILKSFLRGSGYHILSHEAKLKIPNEDIYFYPDVFVNNEPVYEKKFVCHSAVLITEVLSESTRSYDITDKFIQYRKIPELQYYLLIEPIKKIIALFTKDAQGEWQTEFFMGWKNRLIFQQLISILKPRNFTSNCYNKSLLPHTSKANAYLSIYLLRRIN